MAELKTDVGEVHADRLIELVRMVSEIGSSGYHSLLREQSRSLRADLALDADIETKQSWVLGTAKLAVAAPWLIVALLSSRPENASVYNSSGGSTILIGGLLLSAFAYWLIHLMGSLPKMPRVLQ
jgi:tight adherence protein B